jgi:hypothetical protein
MKCIVGHQIKTETGFKVFEVGKDYPPEDTAGREKYFEVVRIAPKKKTKEEVTEDDTASL